MKKTEAHLMHVASAFFRYLGEHLPHMCANDEFYFLPRSEAAVEHLGRLDDLSSDKIRDHIQYVKGLLGDLPSGTEWPVESETDRYLIRRGMESFLREFEDAKVWRHDPSLYLKIPMFALDYFLSDGTRDATRTRSDLAGIMTQISTFFETARKNLREVSELARLVAIRMADDAIGFHERDLTAFIRDSLGDEEALLTLNQEALRALRAYREAISKTPTRASYAVGKDGLEKILAGSLSYFRSPDEILEIAWEGYERTLKALRKLAKEIDSSRSWRTLIAELAPSQMTEGEIMKLYLEEVRNLRRFFLAQEIVNLPPHEKLLTLQTPPYLRSLRATASYRAPLTGLPASKGMFYITPGHEDLELISVHRPYLCAHETYPGHHILDHLRVNHSNPIRRQIESPLFYEGWSCYAEQLLDELGYIRQEKVRLVGLKRRLWRNLRAALDVELQTGRIGLTEGARRIERLGFSPRRAERQIRRFALTPGYQLCYFMGNYEIVRLRERFSTQLSFRRFHECLLGEGQLPFHIVEKRLSQAVCGLEQ